MDTFSIEADGEGFQVRVAGSDDGPGRIAASFPTRQEAQEWIDSQTQIAMKTVIASDGA
jgi:hypothetical protein